MLKRKELWTGMMNIAHLQEVQLGRYRMAVRMAALCLRKVVADKARGPNRCYKLGLVAVEGNL